MNGKRSCPGGRRGCAYQTERTGPAGLRDCLVFKRIRCPASPRLHSAPRYKIPREPLCVNALKEYPRSFYTHMLVSSNLNARIASSATSIPAVGLCLGAAVLSGRMEPMSITPESVGMFDCCVCGNRRREARPAIVPPPVVVNVRHTAAAHETNVDDRMPDKCPMGNLNHPK